jgi:hypothetical protein
MDSMWVASENPNQNLFATGNEMGADMSGVSRIEEGDTWESVREGMGGASFETAEGDYMGAGGVLAEVMRKGGAKGVVDDVAPQRFPSMEAGQHTIMFPGSENQIRSVNAAYDPQYKGSNMMGNADPRLLAGTAAGTALGALAAPMVKDSGMISSPRAGWLWDTTMALRDVERRLEGNPASLLFPSGLVDYLETTNRREEKPNAETRAWALLDVLPW